MEVIFAIGIFVLAAGGLALGLAFGKGPVQTSCGGMSCIGKGACDTCPNRADSERADRA